MAEHLNAIYEFGQQIKTQREGDANIIRITATAGDARTAERMANLVAESYRQENIAARNRLVTESRRFVEEQLHELERKLADAEEALRSFKEREGQVFLTDEAKAALDTFTKLEEQHNTVLRNRGEAERQIAVLSRNDGAFEQDNIRIFTEEQYAQLTALNQRLLDLGQERTALLINYTDSHPVVKEVSQKIAGVKAEMVRELRSKQKTLDERASALGQQIRLYRERYMAFPKAAIQMSRLDRDVKVNADLLESLKIKHQELLIKSAGQIRQEFNIQATIATVRATKIALENLGVPITNTTPMGSYRGAGRPDVAYAVERIVDQAAIDMELDQIGRAHV